MKPENFGKLVGILTFATLVACALLWHSHQKGEAPERPVAVAKEAEGPEIRFDLNEEEVAMITEAGIAQTMVFDRRSYFRGAMRKEYEVPVENFKFSILVRSSGFTAVGIFLPGVDPGPCYMSLDHYLKLQHEQIDVLREILENRKENRHEKTTRVLKGRLLEDGNK